MAEPATLSRPSTPFSPRRRHFRRHQCHASRFSAESRAASELLTPLAFRSSPFLHRLSLISCSKVKKNSLTNWSYPLYTAADLKMVDGAMPPHDEGAGGVVDAPATTDVGIDFRAKGRVSHKIRYRSISPPSRMHGPCSAHVQTGKGARMRTYAPPFCSSNVR